MKPICLSAAVLALCLTACDPQPPTPPAKPEAPAMPSAKEPAAPDAPEAPAAPREGLVGADRDEHGCIGSAGYRWCAKTQQCERPWELAEAEGFENTPEAFKAFCED